MKKEYKDLKKEDMVCKNCVAYNEKTNSCHYDPIPMSLSQEGLDPDVHFCSSGSWRYWEPDAYNYEGEDRGAYRTTFWDEFCEREDVYTAG